jgi:hypothetical protein
MAIFGKQQLWCLGILGQTRTAMTIPVQSAEHGQLEHWHLLFAFVATIVGSPTAAASHSKPLKSDHKLKHALHHQSRSPYLMLDSSITRLPPAVPGMEKSRKGKTGTFPKKLYQMPDAYGSGGSRRWDWNCMLSTEWALLCHSRPKKIHCHCHAQVLSNESVLELSVTTEPLRVPSREWRP